MEQIPIQRQKIVYIEKKDYLELEKKNFLIVLTDFFERTDEKKVSGNGRPPIYFKDMLKSLLIMAYHGMSYRRCRSDLELAKEMGILYAAPKRSTLCKYMNEKSIKEQLVDLIQQSAIYFISSESSMIVDSTWYPLKSCHTGYLKKPNFKKNKSKEIPPLLKTRKLHVALLKNSRIIAYATTSKGTKNDSPLFKEILTKVINNGFDIKVLLADAGYMSKSNYSFAQEKGVDNIFIDFRKNVTGKRAKSKAWKDAFYLWKKDNEYWHESYRYRVIIEGFFSLLKKKFMNWLRTRKAISRDNEMLLKVLAYNLTILGKRI
ncbi:transposase [Candidatus Pacearchaeota archaeon]|nr:hypothetical protein [uncultured archaeon]MBS3091499.1 transposase [Candidatus Pacearchaeota archaeon]